MIEQPTTSPTRLDVGAGVDVRNRFLGGWSHGFEVAQAVDDGYLIRRVSDGAVLPDVISRNDVRRDRHTRGTWWY